VIPGAGGVRRVMHYLGNVGMTGVETFLLTLCASQHRGGLEPSIACDPEDRDELLASAAAMNVAIHPFPLALPVSSARGAARKIASATFRGKRVQRLAQLLSTTGTEVLHVHPVGVGGLDAFLAARRAGVPYVVTHHATLEWFEPFRTKLSDFTFWFEKRSAARIVCPYRAARDEMISHGVAEEQAAVVPFCVDPRKFEQTPADPAPPGSPFRLFIVARLIEGKGHRDLLQAVAKLSHLHSTLRVVVLGDGAERRAIESEVQRLGLHALVELMGHVANEKVPALMQTASAVVLPSYMPGETFPLSLIEGMAMRLPAIGSRWFGIPDIVAHGETGFVVEPRDVAGLAQAIERLVTSPDLARRMGQNGYERAMKLFTADAVADAYERIYREARMSRLH
jgi:glycosyltransferase involved in cell wall biosynthesis